MCIGGGRERGRCHESLRHEGTRGRHWQGGMDQERVRERVLEVVRGCRIGDKERPKEVKSWWSGRRGEMVWCVEVASTFREVDRKEGEVSVQVVSAFVQLAHIALHAHHEPGLVMSIPNRTHRQ